MLDIVGRSALLVHTVTTSKTSRATRSDRSVQHGRWRSCLDGSMRSLGRCEIWKGNPMSGLSTARHVIVAPWIHGRAGTRQNRPDGAVNEIQIPAEPPSKRL